MHLPLVIRGIPIIPHDFTDPSVMVAMRALSLPGGPLLTMADLVLALILLWRRRWGLVILLILAVGGGELVNMLLKWLFAHPRPPWRHPLLVLTSAGFPSGHALRSGLCWGFLGFGRGAWHGSWHRRMWIGAAGVLVLLIGVSRLYLEAHGLSEVLAGCAAGGVWLAVTIAGVETVQREGGER